MGYEAKTKKVAMYEPNTQETEIAKNTFDIRTMSLEQLARDLKASYDKKQPKSIFFKGRQNRKIELDNQRKRLLLDGLDQLRAHNAGMLELQADALLTEDTFKHIVNMRQLDFQMEFEKKILEMNVYKKEVDHTLAKLDHEIMQYRYESKKLVYQLLREEEETTAAMLDNEARRRAIDRMDVAIESGKIDNESKIIMNRMNNAKANLMDKFEKEVDIDSFPKAMQSYAMVGLFGYSGSDYGQFEKDQINLEFIRDELRQNLRKKQYEADSLKSRSVSDESQSDIDRSTADVAMDRNERLKKNR